MESCLSLHRNLQNLNERSQLEFLDNINSTVDEGNEVSDESRNDLREKSNNSRENSRNFANELDELVSLDGDASFGHESEGSGNRLSISS